MGAVVAAGVAGCGASATRTASHPARPLRPARAAPAEPPPPPGLVLLRATLAALLRQAGAQSGAEVLDLTTDQRLFALRADVKRPPASVEKLFTTIAVLDKLGPNARLRTRVLGAGHLTANGIWLGDLYLVGGGDPTFGDGAFNRAWEQGYGPTPQQLVAQLAARGIRGVSGAVIGDDSLFDPRPGGPATDYRPDVADLGGELSALTFDHGATAGSLSAAAFAARQLARTMRAEHMEAHAAPFTRRAPPGAVTLASVDSPPIAVLLRLMDVPSDDLIAELLTEQLGARFAGRGSIAAGAQVIAQVASIWGVHPAIIDGSGLSRRDRASPAEVVALLQAVWGTKTGTQLEAALPLLGVNGTVARIALGTPAQGSCAAKTGTLDRVTNLAGYCRDRRHHQLAFAFFIDGPDNGRAVQLIGQMAAAIVRY
jgi:D-alanyl-D-alanine carboxypeptidase/D-alanyl-D-alanine-endopeptidase (penicillin-binding protein 4)